MPITMRPGFGLQSDAQSHLRSMREFLDGINIFTMEPHNDLLSERVNNEAYCLAEPPRQYAVFFTGDGDGRVRIELADSKGPLHLRWLDIATTRWVKRATTSSRRNYILRAPGSGHWVAVMTAANP